MSAENLRRKARPAYPSPARQWQGILLTLFAIGCLLVFIQNGGTMRSPGSILWLVVMFVAYWSGLRAGIIASALTMVFLVFAYSNPHTVFVYSDFNRTRLISGAIFFPAFALLVGSIQGRMRNAAIREYDAREAAEKEAMQRAETEGALRSSEDMRQLVVDSALDAIVAMRQDGTVSLWNKNAETIFGWTSDEAIGRLLADLIVPPAYRAAHAEGIRRFIETGEANIFDKRMEFQAIASDGRELPIELSVVPHKTSEGYIFVGFIRDLTQQKDLNDRLRRAQKMEAIGTLAGGIAHDFNNILAAIAGNLSLARSDADSGKNPNESFAEIDKAVTRAAYVVRQILRFSSPNDTESVVIDLAVTLEEALQFLRASLPATIEIESDFERGMPAVVANSTDIHQILLNLGINAQLAMRGQAGKFRVSARHIELDEPAAGALLCPVPGRYVLVSVSDTGVGMDAATLDRIFEPFFTTRGPGEGTGLGLAVVYGIMERHHGAIAVDSEPGKGTTFRLYFPAAQSAAEMDDPAVQPSEMGNGERILYVDDDEALVFMTKRLLSRLNYEVVGFERPREALGAFKADPRGFDLVITDMSMPQLDGPALVHQLQEVRQDIPIVMVTGYIRPDDLEQARDLGIRKLILKPNTVHEMADTLHLILQEIKSPDSRPVRSRMGSGEGSLR